MKKLIFFMLSLTLIMALGGCQAGDSSVSDFSTSSDTSSVVEPMQISFADLVIDLSDPENVVSEADPFEDSKVFDAAGRKLTEKEWLLNSKFAKSYIKSLPLGEHIFEYSSATKYGTIKIVITDNAAPQYLFSFGLESVLKYEEKQILPRLVKDQDSYQDDYDISYELYQVESETKTIIPVLEEQDGYSADLVPGYYQWVATTTLNDKTHKFSLDFRKESFDEYIIRKKDVLLYDAGRGVYVKNVKGQYEINTTVQEYYTYSVPNDIINNAIKAGKRIGIRLTMTEPTKTRLWITNGYWGSQNERLTWPYDGDSVEKDTFTITTYVEDGKYVYGIVTDLRADQFAKNESLAVLYTSQFNPSREDSDTWQSISASLEIWFE